MSSTSVTEYRSVRSDGGCPSLDCCDCVRHHLLLSRSLLPSQHKLSNGMPLFGAGLNTSRNWMCSCSSLDAALSLLISSSLVLYFACQTQEHSLEQHFVSIVNTDNRFVCSVQQPFRLFTTRLWTTVRARDSQRQRQLEPRGIKSKTMVTNYCESHEHSEAVTAVLLPRPIALQLVVGSHHRDPSSTGA